MFRAGGTSLNGQSQTDGMLVDVPPPLAAGSRSLDGGARVPRPAGRRCSATSTACWRRHGRKLGPDPASTDIACVGGVIANNSGGMRCGVVADSYQHRALDDVRAARTAP